MLMNLKTFNICTTWWVSLLVDQESPRAHVAKFDQFRLVHSSNAFLNFCEQNFQKILKPGSCSIISQPSCYVFWYILDIIFIEFVDISHAFENFCLQNFLKFLKPGSCSIISQPSSYVFLVYFGHNYHRFWLSFIVWIENRWRGFSTRNVRMVHVVNLSAFKWC